MSPPTLDNAHFITLHTSHCRETFGDREEDAFIREANNIINEHKVSNCMHTQACIACKAN